MSTAMLYYLAWQEDDWLDEVLDRFPEVNALVPTVKTFEMLAEQRESGEVKHAVLVLNAAQEQERCREFLQLCKTHAQMSRDPLYIVGLKPEEEEAWQEAYPNAKIIVITGFAVEFDYDAVLARMEIDLEGAH
ncbi:MULTISPECIES: hypothetical protein [Brevibacillus]|jgi:tryptophan synthase alpha subunit|uniref:Uncharacterized protein n=1 Tax=Brevibacillus centrosporus TaxID=54910 RepID=A0A1I3VMQ6_9BACL|nr:MULTISPECIES: hypothetical protein [Brevibacillus]MEC2130796.1 hypothetical protein [Brevibacillus centrosporus]MED1796653.1 hypothetical protein [Brevibacillus nitrificans]MED1953336.1 hypothetical protein [Brevibacillus centrosporus]MED4908111.1 hypothetical protein [Brevibacillus centrosporus]RNB69177.1 hypothetical protein EDM55_14555 [Brevibacillus centrosporus]